mgnify:CR=1 FL=1
MEGEARKTWGTYRLAIFIREVTWGNHPLELEMNVKWDGTITLRVTQWVHFVLGVWIVTGTQACRCNRYSYSTPSRCSPAAFQPADLSHLTLGGNSPFALSVSPRPLAAKLLNLEARNYLNLRWEICKRT